MTVRDACPGCGSNQIKKNGHIHNGRQNHRCKAGGRQFVVLAETRVIAEERRTLVARLLREKLPSHGTCRAVGVGMKWLMRFMVACFNAAPEHLHVRLPGGPRAILLRRLGAEADEMCTFVRKKVNKQWRWLAMDTSTRQILASYVGARSRKSAEHLWAKIPVAYREQATFYTDRYEAYTRVVPAIQHKAITKLARKTNDIERFNNTLRQRVSRLVRDT